MKLNKEYYIEKRDEHNIALMRKFKPTGKLAKKEESLKVVGYFGTAHGAVKRFLEIAPYEGAENILEVFSNIEKIKNEILMNVLREI